MGGHVREFFDTAFETLRRGESRHEYVYKAALTHKILLGKHSLQTASMLTEFRVGGCKADVAILNGTSTVYEIKSERDSLSRLENQIRAYKRFFAKIYVIAGENHVENVKAVVSPDVGILCLSSRHQISTLRDAVELPERVCPLAIFESIRSDEAKHVLKLLDVPVPNVPNTELHFALKERFAKLDPVGVHNAMVKTLKKSRNLLRLAELVSSLPPSLHSAALTVPLRKVDHDRLISACDVPLKTAVAWS